MNKRKYRLFVICCLVLDLLVMLISGYRYLDRKIPDEIQISRGKKTEDVTEVLSTPFVTFEEAVTVSQDGGYILPCKLLGYIPFKEIKVTPADDQEIYVSGSTIGIYMQTEGVLVIDTGEIQNRNGETEEPARNIIRQGDYIISFNGEKISTKRELIDDISELDGSEVTLGISRKGESIPVLEPVLTYQIILPEGCDAHNTFNKLKQLEEEDPQLDIVWNENLKEIHARLMGDVQIEILQSLIKERFDIDVTFGQGSIVYKETIKNKVEGIGHFEPLRHYAEVHLLLEPGEPGSGMVFETACKEDDLDKNWQRLILTHLYEKQHVGVLTGSHITDMKITLIGGRAHAKHTEGGDFRQATYRAVRNGLKQAESVLLEPYYEFTLEVPTENVGRAMNDISQMKGEFETPKTNGEVTEITGYAPVSTMSGYITTVNTYTRGRGRLYCKLAGYMPCHNASEVIMDINYDSERDVENPTGSVFCAHGAGFNVEWDKVKDYAHVTTDNLKDNDYEEPEKFVPVKQPEPGKKWQMGASYAEDKELQAIFEKQFGPVKRRLANESGFGYTDNQGSGKRTQKEYVYKENKNKKNEKKYLLVDGYNVIFAWKELNELAQVNLDGARFKLMDIMSNYQGYKQCELILVFDAYKVKGNIGEVSKYNKNVVYTKEAETADTYIEKVTNEIGKKYQVTVATSDRLEQMIVLSRGAVRMSSNELLQDVMAVHEAGLRQYKSSQKIEKNYLDELINK